MRVGVDGHAMHVMCVMRVMRVQAGSDVRQSIGIWSLAWSPSDSIVAAGTSQPGIILYDLAAERRLAAASCHHDDVNAVAFADAGGNLLVSGSDDSRLFLHDRCATRCRLRRRVGHHGVPAPYIPGTLYAVGVWSSLNHTHTCNAAPDSTQGPMHDTTHA